MPWKTIDLDTKEGMEQYEKLSKNHSIRETFGEDAVPKRKKKANFSKPKEMLAEEEKKEEVKEEPVEETSKSVVETEPTPEPVKEEPKIDKVARGAVTGVSQLRVRNAPNGDVISVISHNTIVTILDDLGQWLKVEYARERVGYVMSEYIRKYTETTGG